MQEKVVVAFKCITHFLFIKHLKPMHYVPSILILRFVLVYNMKSKLNILKFVVVTKGGKVEYFCETL